MDELGDKLSAILNDPESMERVKQMAQSLLGGEDSGTAVQNNPAPPAALPADDINIKQIVSLFSKMKNTADDSRVQLIYALRPHLSEERRARADTAIKLLKLLDMLPRELRPDYEEVLHPSDEQVRELVKAADKLSAHIKCLEEEKAGNHEFCAAARQTRQALEDMHLPEVDLFLEEFLPSFRLTLDELE